MLIIAGFDTLEHFSSEEELPITDLVGDIGYDAATSVVGTAVIRANLSPYPLD